MSKSPSIRKNFIMNALLSMSSILFPLITFPYVSRILLADGMGKVTFATSFVAYFGMIAKLGIPTYGVRACAKVRDDREQLSRVSHELLIINLGMSVLAYLGLAVSMIAVPRVQSDWTLFAVISVTIFLDAIGMEWLYRGLEQYTYITVRSLIFKFIALGATFLLVHHPEDVVVYGGITILASSASNILNFVNVHKYISLKPVGGYSFRRHWKAVAVFFAMACATTIYTNLDAVMLGFMKTDADVGYYNAAIKIKTVLLSLVTALGTVLLPRLSYYLENGEEKEFNRITGKALQFVILLASPLSVYFILYAKESILLLSGAAYLEAVTPMRIIMPTVILIGITNVLGIQILVPMGKEKTVLYSEIAGAVVDVILNALLIPGYGPAGAAVGTLVAEIAVLAVQYSALRDRVRDQFLKIRWLRIGIGLAAAAAACIWVKWLGTGAFLTLAVSWICFAGVYYGYMLWQKEEQVIDITGRVIGRFRHEKKE